MTVDILRHAGTAEQVGQAERAVKAFRKLQPTLTSYARVLTGKKNVRVDMAARDNGSTDGTRIYFRPPIALGDPTPHNRHLCDKRDEDGKMICPACAIREKVLVTIMHEIAHIAFDSFQKATDRDKVRAIEFAIKESKGQYADRIKARINGAPEYVTSNFMGLANLINEYLPFLINCLEDARVNHEMFKVRPGLKRMFTVDTIEVFEKGFENRDADGILRTKHWREAPLNSQVMIGVFCKASGYNYGDWFHPKVIEALGDPELTELVDRMDGIESAGAVYNLAFQVLARLRELGFCGTPQDPDAEPEEEQDEDDSEDQENGSSDEADEPEDGGAGSSGEPGEDAGAESEGNDSGDEQGDHDASSSPEQGEGEADSDPSEDGSAEPEDESGGEVDEQEGTGGGSDSQEPGPDGDSDSDSDADSDGADADRDAEGEEDGEGSSDAGSDTDSDSAGSDGQAPGEEQLDGTDSQDDSSEGEASSEGETGVPSVPSPGEPGTEEGEPSDSGPAPEGGGTGIEPERETPEGEDSDEVGETSDGSSEDGEGDEPSDSDSVQSDEDVAADDDDPIDSGADDGYGGTSLLGEDEEDDTPPMGEPDDVDPIIKQWGQHDEKPKSVAEKQEETAVDRAIVQGIYFTRPSKNVFGVRERRFDEDQDYASAWRRYKNGRKYGQVADIDVPESILQPAILKMRRAFTDNQIGSLDTNRRSGRVNRRVLGRRAWAEDDRLFSKKTQPGKKDYEVIIGMDISGSTIGRNLALEKRAIMAQATMLDRVGVPFSIVAHTGDYHDGHNTKMGLDLQVYHIKDHGEPWNDKTIERLQAIGHSAANLDGHALEYLRKRADESRAVEKIILYYSDGKMPAENHDEELSILTSEIALCRQKGYTLLGVGIRTDSPRRHGLDTVEVHEDADLVKVVEHLAKRLSGTVRR